MHQCNFGLDVAVPGVNEVVRFNVCTYAHVKFWQIIFGTFIFIGIINYMHTRSIFYHCYMLLEIVEYKKCI